MLADPVKHKPSLAQGFPELSAGKAPPPAKGPRGVDSMTLEAPDADPNDLPLQRWGIIIPDSPAGDSALEAIEPLRALRQKEQDAPIQVFRVPPGMDLEKSLDWKNQVLYNEDALPEEERPRFLLILGDLDEVSAELGHVLANGSFVGRIHFDELNGYKTYADKVARWEREPSKFEKATARFFVANDETTATKQGDRYLVKPCLELARRRTRRPFPADVEEPFTDVKGASDFIAKCSDDKPSMLLSVCHGLGRSSSFQWASVDEQRRLQGALVLPASRSDEELVMGEKVLSGPFLPGGFWFAFACFGAGTPSTSAFYPWLRQLANEGEFEGAASDVLQSLPAKGERPFLAALPKAALANPSGPLGVIGHLDLAWTYGFVDSSLTNSRASRIFGSLRVMANGSRAGVALDALMRSYREVNDELLSGYEAEKDAQVFRQTFAVDTAKRAHAFMLRNDLRGYVLLGDPAARLPLAR